MMSMEPASVGEAAKALIRHFCPGATEDELKLRARIQMAQGRATTRRHYCNSPDAARLYGIASSLACIWYLRQNVVRDDLWELIKVLTWLFLAAAALERLEAVDVE